MLYQMQKKVSIFINVQEFFKPWGDYQPVSFIHSKVKSTLDLKSAVVDLSPQAALGPGWDVASGEEWVEDPTLTITCSSRRN